jgi:hypothetical protein
MNREAMMAAVEHLSRRGFFKRTVKAAGIGLFCDKYGPQVFAQAASIDPKTIMSAMGNIVIPIDDDPGFATFEPGISDYALNVMTKQVLLGGNEILFQGILGTMVAFNEIPFTIGYATRRFLEMPESLQSSFYGQVLQGAFDNFGVQDILFTAAFVGLFSSKATFFSNYPYHLATPGAEFQILPANKPRTGWDIMGFRGTVGPAEETALRTRYKDHKVNPGMDPNNPYI